MTDKQPRKNVDDFGLWAGVVLLALCLAWTFSKPTQSTVTVPVTQTGNHATKEQHNVPSSTETPIRG
jgi:hypothetical protein